MMLNDKLCKINVSLMLMLRVFMGIDASVLEVVRGGAVKVVAVMMFSVDDWDMLLEDMKEFKFVFCEGCKFLWVDEFVVVLNVFKKFLMLARVIGDLVFVRRVM